MTEVEHSKGLATPVRYVKGVGEARANQLARLDITTVGDLLLTLPRRYEDRRSMKRIATLHSGDQVVVSGTIVACGMGRPRYGKAYFEAALDDGSGVALCRWYSAHYLQDQLRVGQDLIVYGKVSLSRGKALFRHPEFELLDPAAGPAGGAEDSLHMGSVVPVYPLTEDLPQRTMRRILREAVDGFSEAAEEALPASTRARHGLPGIGQALREVHFPPKLEAAKRARYRLIFEEFLCMQLVLVARKVHAERDLAGTSFTPDGALRDRFVASLPFGLTGAQERVLGEIRADMAAPHPMHRLLQGDVGSGKTVVAACALLDACECGAQGAIMAPTEILAGQHAQTFAAYLSPLGVRIALLTGDVSGKERRTMLDQIASGEIQVVAGTHALIQEGVVFKRLGLAVIDEQHRFGVEQRGLLYEKGAHPDVLVMTATPIPRTLAMTVYGDLDVSLLDEMPPGRPEIVTRVIKEEQLPDAYEFVRKQAAKGRQAYLIYPLVSESDKVEMRSATKMYGSLAAGVFADLRLGLLHGQMPAEEKAGVMGRFRAGDIDVLVATTVVEVGIDVPNATVMLVENAERFGLAQLHQLRGRVGRGRHKSFCILQGRPASLESWKRLRVMQESTDGFHIAEEDLNIRGMGNLLGREQSGLPVLRVGDPVADREVLYLARQEAFTIVEEDPSFKDPQYAPLRAQARGLYKAVGAFVSVG